MQIPILENRTYNAVIVGGSYPLLLQFIPFQEYFNGAQGSPCQDLPNDDINL